MTSTTTLPPLPLPDGISSRHINCDSTVGLSFHILEAGTPSPTTQDAPLVLLVHGFPELAFSWRKVMLPLADAGYYVVAMDQRGYGRTTGWDRSAFDKIDFTQFCMTQLVRDLLSLVSALGYSSVHCIVGHDFGAVTAGLCALTRPDFFRSCVTMSHPFKSVPRLPSNAAHESLAAKPSPIEALNELAKLPEPRKHYKWYNSTPQAASEWETPSQGLHAFLRGYLHLKSADWKGNNPFPLKGWTATELAKMPHYYVLPLNATMPEAIAAAMQSEDATVTKRWMPDADLDVYVQEWSRTGFQGGLNWYRVGTDPAKSKDLQLFAGRTIDCPAIFITGASDWGNYQEPGALEKLPESCTQFKGVRMIPAAGHWPQQEQPELVVKEISAFLSILPK